MISPLFLLLMKYIIPAATVKVGRKDEFHMRKSANHRRKVVSID